MSEARLWLSEEMVSAINRVAEAKGVSPESVLKRAIFTYTDKHDRPINKVDTTNVVMLRRED